MIIGQKNMGTMRQKETKIHLEILRILAIILVLFNHTREHGFDLYKNVTLSISGITSYTLAIFCKIAVPLFFMISGALLIPKEETYKELFLKRILRMILVLVLFTLLQYVRLCYATRESFDIVDFFRILYADNIIQPYWYLKAYLGYLLVLPLLRAAAKSFAPGDYRYIAVLGGILMGCNVILILTGYSMNVNLVLCADIIFYPLLGYALEQGYSPKFLAKRGLSAILLVGILVVTVFFGELYHNITGLWNETFLAVSVFPMATLFYALVRGPKDGLRFASDRVNALIQAMGSCVFGVYLIEDVIRNVLDYRLHWNFAIPSPCISALLYSVVCVLIGFVCIYPLKKIPFLKKII